VVKVLQRQINGALNRLSDQTKDSILNTLQNIYQTNSVNITNELVKAGMINACCKDSQTFTTLIPLYGALIAALHFTVSIDVGAYMVEMIASLLVCSLEKLRDLHQQDDRDNDLCSRETNQASNYLLVLVYLYNFRAIHHSLINDLIDKIVGEDVSTMNESNIEFLLLVIDHCGFQLRSDDPVNMKSIIAKLFAWNKQLSTLHHDSSDERSGIGGRYQYMLDTLTDLKNNKSRRVQNMNLENIKVLRKWIGSVKAKSKNAVERTLHVSLNELLSAESKGRWWKAGASWKGKDVGEEKASTSNEAVENSVRIGDVKLEKLAQKLHLTTDIRKNILYAIMKCRDVHDAYDAIMKISLKGRQDREIGRVIMECATNEKTYNRFYGELASLLCNENRQLKATFQFLYWDSFQLMQEGAHQSSQDMKKFINLSELLAHLVIAFQVPIAVLRRIDMTALNEATISFLGKFFMEVFNSNVRICTHLFYHRPYQLPVFQ
jgi:nucleolar MIF4G domain-containing protein 1